MTGLTCMQLNRFSEAVKPLEEALKLDKNVAETYFVLGDAYLKLKRARESILLFKAGLALKKIPAYEKKLRETRSNVMGLDTNACSIQNALEQGMKYRSRGISVTPAIDVKVEFQLNKATLS
ncbi:MAG: tetratricopeptide repeat protein, partial [bacterium]|nr:tetratricopeptide repeat protein [bacterium]